MIVAILMALFFAAMAAWGWSQVRRERKRAQEAEAKAQELARCMKKMQEAYRVEAERLEELARGSDTDKFDASIRILRGIAGTDADPG